MMCCAFIRRAILPLLVTLMMSGCTFIVQHVDAADGYDRPCDTTLGVVSLDTIKQLGSQFFSPLVAETATTTTLTVATNILYSAATYDVQVLKLCASCQKVEYWLGERGAVLPASFRIYCDPDNVFGYDITQSALVLVPVTLTQPGDEPIMPNKTLRTFLTLPASQPDLTQSAASVAFPDDWFIHSNSSATNATTTSSDNSTNTANNTATTAAVTQPIPAEWVPALMAAASGSIAIIPDYLGTGESQNVTNRTYFWPPSYMQATVVHFLNLQQYVNTTWNCTEVDHNYIVLAGWEDGAMGAVFGAQVLRRFPGMDVAIVDLNAAIMDLDTFLLDTITTLNINPFVSTRLRQLLELTTFCFSENFPTGFGMVNEKYRTYIDALYQSTENITTLDNTTAVPAHPLDILNAPILDMYLKGETCRSLLQSLNISDANSTTTTADANSTVTAVNSTGSSDAMQSLCEAIVEATGWVELGNNGTRKWENPTEICKSDDDKITTSSQYPADILAKQVRYIHIYDGPIGATDNVFKPVGNHDEIFDLCAVSVMLYWTLQGHRPDNEQDRANYQADLTDPATCYGSPGIAPTNSSGIPTSGGAGGGGNPTSYGNSTNPGSGTPAPSPITSGGGGNSTGGGSPTASNPAQPSSATPPSAKPTSGCTGRAAASSRIFMTALVGFGMMVLVSSMTSAWMG